MLQYFFHKILKNKIYHGYKLSSKNILIQQSSLKVRLIMISESMTGVLYLVISISYTVYKRVID